MIINVSLLLRKRGLMKKIGRKAEASNVRLQNACEKDYAPNSKIMKNVAGY